MSTVSFAVGELIAGKFRIEGQLGGGGTGFVLAARNVVLDEPVAIKVLHAEQLKHPTAVARFLREAKVAASLRSEHVAAVYDAGEMPNGAPFLVMEYLEGETLGALLSRSVLPVRQAVDFAIQICEGLAATHARNVIHRDIKPENIFIARRPGTRTAKILDFGIAKATHLSLLEPPPVHVGDFQILGTPAYISPEQLRDPSSVDERADVWSLGVTLFEMLTTLSPFDGDTIEAICLQISEGRARRLRSRVSNAPEFLDEIIARCLSNAKDRFPNVAELATALTPFASSSGPIAARRIERTLYAAGKIDQPTLFSSAPPPLFLSPNAIVSEEVTNLCMSLVTQGASGVALVQVSSGTVVAVFGEALALETTATQYVGLMGMLGRFGALFSLGMLADVVVETGSLYAVIRPLVTANDLCVCVLTDRKGAAVSRIRGMLSKVDARER